MQNIAWDKTVLEGFSSKTLRIKSLVFIVMFELVLPIALLALGMIILTFSSIKIVDHSVVLACNWSVPPMLLV